MRQYTSLTDDEQRTIADQLVIEAFSKGTVLLRQGDPIRDCYFVLKGCVRQFALDEKGKETTSNFYTEEQFIALFTILSNARNPRC
ncbi:Crp/Fnr family transcriptional regulator [Paenibacillus andongensis]|uniref:Crp/Fnr family transcriptional regulator n=1 Tax=Paenibacillus andongensis TaxID=2975482 RepID=UPI0021BB99F6|nr:cyclic nucleotide-binding domain-containing protein [Paenibacillus andongensis]